MDPRDLFHDTSYMLWKYQSVVKNLLLWAALITLLYLATA